MNKSGNELQFVQLDADWVGLAEKVLVKQGMSVEEVDYQNEHGIDLTQDQKLADWWADTAEDYE